MKNIWLIGLAFLMGCSSEAKKKEKELGPLKTVNHVDIQKYMGPWYVIADIPLSPEKGETNAVETYTWNEEKQRIDVDFRFHQDSPQGKLKKIPQQAYIKNKETNAEWKSEPFGIPFAKFSYLILDLAPDYSYALASGSDRSNVWILARKPQLDDATYDKLVSKSRDLGFDTTKLVKVPQVWN